MKLEHVAIYVDDLEKVKVFFQTYFNAAVSTCYHNPTTDFRSYFLTFENDTRLEIMYHPQAVNTKKDFRRSGYAHIAFQLGSRSAVDELTQKLKADGYAVVSGPRVTGDGYYESCILDLEGNQIELTA